MNNTILDHQVRSTFETLCQHLELGKYIDTTLEIPQAFCGAGPVLLIVIGQDPTVDNPKSRQGISTVLNLNKSGNLTTYLRRICSYLDIDLNQQVYATNLYKNFFTIKPTENNEINIFQEFLPHWLPVLISELEQFPDVPVLTLGEPLLSTIVTGQASGKVSQYWGYSPGWKSGEQNPFAHLKPETNMLNRVVFPYPHQPSWQRKKFYSDRLEQYSVYAKQVMKAITQGK